MRPSLFSSNRWSRFLGALALCVVACDKPTPRQESPESAPSATAAPAASVPAAVVTAPKETRPSAPMNVLLLTIDSLRADMPWTGYEKEIAPNLSKLAGESVVYTNHRSVSSYTAQTVATLMTGRFASTLYRTGVFFTNYFADNVWITEEMQKKGIATLSVQAHLYFDRAPGLKQGFDVWKLVPGLTWNAQTDESVTSVKSVDAMLELLADPARETGNFFLWAHLMDPHDQYVKHEGAPDFGKDNRGRYDSEVWFVDRELGRLFAFLETKSFAKNTAIIVSADHGETFGEHGMFKHAFELWEPLVRIPLLVKAPGALPKRIDVPRTHIDVGPTIIDLLAMPPLPSFQGKSMVPEIYGAPAESREPILLELAEDTNNPARRAIIVGTEKLIVFDGGARKGLFDLSSDPGEEKDLSKERPERVKALSEALDAAFAALPVVEPAGGAKLRSGKSANGPRGDKK